MSYRSGFVALVGKPNVGKSTLVNRLVGRKVAITSKKPQTTRQRMMGVVHGDDFQAVMVDTPGIMMPKRRLHKKMISTAGSEAKSADLVLWLVELTHSPTDEDKNVAHMLREKAKKYPVWLVLNKMDLAREGVAESYVPLLNVERTFTLSATTGEGVPDLFMAISKSLPEGPMFFPPDQVTDQNDKLWMAEVIREKVLVHTRQEVPHAVAVTVEELRSKTDGEGLYARAVLYVERETQKKILIGKGGGLLKRVGTESRRELEKAWGQSIYLDLWVKVKPDWRERDDWLKHFGYG